MRCQAVSSYLPLSDLQLDPETSNPERKKFDGYIALGCVIREETSHYDYVCGESARGLNDLVLEHGIALGYGVFDYRKSRTGSCEIKPRST